MRYFLLKTEPGEYSITRLKAEARVFWDGVENALALKNLALIQPKDACFIYHTGKEKAIVGLAEALSEVEDRPSGKGLMISFLAQFPTPLTLNEIKTMPVFEGFDLIRLPRLSVMPVQDVMAKAILEATKG